MIITSPASASRSDQPCRECRQQHDRRQHVHEEHEREHYAYVGLELQRREHPSDHADGERNAGEDDAGARHPERGLIGIVHGLAGSAAVALLVLGTIREARWAVFYLLVFGMGTIVGMMLMTLAFAVPFTLAGNRFAWLNKGLVTATGLVSLVLGLFVAYQIGFVDGLFTAHPSWIPQ